MTNTLGDLLKFKCGNCGVDFAAYGVDTAICPNHACTSHRNILLHAIRDLKEEIKKLREEMREAKLYE